MRLRLVPLEKKQLLCLRCGVAMWTDAAHRMCRKCRRRNSETYEVQVYSIGEGLEDITEP